LCAQQQHHPQAQQRAVQDNSPTQNITTNQPTNLKNRCCLALNNSFFSLKTPELFGNIEIKCLGKKNNFHLELE
jgi:hypothetical protein